MFAVSNVGRIETAMKALKRVYCYICTETAQKIIPISGLAIAPKEIMNKEGINVQQCKSCTKDDFSYDHPMGNSDAVNNKEKAGLPNFGIYSFDDLTHIVSSESKRTEQQSCAYHAARSLISTANIIVCTQQTILDPKLSHALLVVSEKTKSETLIVFDESHNIGNNDETIEPL